MAIDMNRLAAAALDAAVNGDHPPKRRLSGGKAVAAGAALGALARVGMQRRHHLPRLLELAELRHRLSEFPDALRDRLGDHAWAEPEEEAEWDDEEEPLDEEGFESEGDEDDEDDEDEDDDEEDEDDGGRGPEAEEEPDYEPEESDTAEPTAGLDIDLDEQSARRPTPDLEDVLGAHRARPPVLDAPHSRLHPAANPPEPLRRTRNADSKARRKEATAGRR